MDGYQLRSKLVDLGISDSAFCKMVGIEERQIQDWHGNREDVPGWVGPSLDQFEKIKRLEKELDEQRQLVKTCTVKAMVDAGPDSWSASVVSVLGWLLSKIAKPRLSCAEVLRRTTKALGGDGQERHAIERFVQLAKDRRIQVIGEPIGRKPTWRRPMSYLRLKVELEPEYWEKHTLNLTDAAVALRSNASPHRRRQANDIRTVWTERRLQSRHDDMLYWRLSIPYDHVAVIADSLFTQDDAKA